MVKWQTHIFGLQKDNIRNQRENVILALANAQVRLGLPAESEPVSNFIVWCYDKLNLLLFVSYVLEYWIHIT